MVSKKTIIGLDFKNIYEYYDYILDSKHNGNKQQAKVLFHALSSKQKQEFYEFVIPVVGANEFVKVLDYVNH